MSVNATGCGQPVAIPNRASSAKEPATPNARAADTTLTPSGEDRYVHERRSHGAPLGEGRRTPGEAKSDLDIFLDYARRMDFRDKDGQPLIKWDDPESAFEAWKECSRGRPCDYTGITYDKLRGSSGVQWPCNNEHPDSTERLYADGDFNTETDYCETYGRDLLTGAVQDWSRESEESR